MVTTTTGTGDINAHIATTVNQYGQIDTSEYLCVLVLYNFQLL